MIEVNLNNYEAYAIDYLEGRLTGEDLSVFESFLINHPKIKDELDSFNPEILSFESNVEFDLKTDLKKEALLSEDINLNNYQTYFIAFHEGDLSDKTREQINDFIRLNPVMEKEFEAYAKMRFAPDKSMRFPLKRQTKKSTPVRALYRGLRIAASVVILLGMGWYVKQLNKDEQQYSERTHPTEIKKDVKSIVELNPLDHSANELAEQSIEADNNKEKEILPGSNPLVAIHEETLVEYKFDTREKAPRMASASVKNISIDQQANTGLRFKKAIESDEAIAKNGSIIKIKIPKLFKRKSDSLNDDESTTLARAKIKFSKSKKIPNRVNYVDLGPLKVYKKKSITASSSNLERNKHEKGL